MVKRVLWLAAAATFLMPCIATAAAGEADFSLETTKDLLRTNEICRETTAIKSISGN